MWKAIRKFGLEYCDFPTMLWNLSCMLRPLTINFDIREKRRIPLVFYILVSIASINYIYVYFFSMIWFVFYRCIKTADLIAAMIVFPLGITSEIGVTKFIFTILNEKKIRYLLQQYLECDSKVVQDSRFSINLLKALRNVKTRAVIYWVIIISNGTIYILKPIFMPGRHSMEEIFILYGLDPPLETPNYEISYLMMAMGSIYTCYLTSNMACFLIILSGYVEAQILALSEELLNVWNDAEDQHFRQAKLSNYEHTSESIEMTDDAAINEIVKYNLRKLAKAHITNINFLNKIEDIFRGAFAIEFIILSVGLIAELLGCLENTYMEVPFAIIQVTMDCITGQNLINACDVFERALYSCQWEKFNSSNMKTVYLMLTNSQKTLTLSAGGITILNYASLMSVFKSIYSAFTTLQSVM